LKRSGDVLACSLEQVKQKKRNSYQALGCNYPFKHA